MFSIVGENTNIRIRHPGSVANYIYRETGDWMLSSRIHNVCNNMKVNEYEKIENRFGDELTIMRLS